MRSRTDIASDYHAARDANAAGAMRRFQNEEACLVLLNILERLAFDPSTFIQLTLTRHRQWRPGLWRLNLEPIERTWLETLESWVEPSRLPAFPSAVDDVTRRLRELRLD